MSTPELTQFGEKLKLLRTVRGLTLKRLATALGMDAHGYLSELESGKKLPSAILVVKLARLFDVSTDVLLRDELDLDGKGGGR